jgi:hypothetical protein
MSLAVFSHSSAHFRYKAREARGEAAVHKCGSIGTIKPGRFTGRNLCASQAYKAGRGCIGDGWKHEITHALQSPKRFASFLEAFGALGPLLEIALPEKFRVALEQLRLTAKARAEGVGGRSE